MLQLALTQSQLSWRSSTLRSQYVHAVVTGYTATHQRWPINSETSPMLCLHSHDIPLSPGVICGVGKGIW